MLNVVHYALGGGLGHFTRQFSIAAELKAVSQNHRSILVTNSQFAQALEEHFNGITVIALGPNATASQVATRLSGVLRGQEASTLIVDTFPRGIGGELAKVLESTNEIQRILIARNLPSDYIATFQLNEFVSQNYEAVFRIEDQAPFLSQASVTTPPIVYAKQWNAKALDVAFQHLNISEQQDPSRPIVLIVASGNLQECESYNELANRLKADSDMSHVTIRFAAPTVGASAEGQRLVERTSERDSRTNGFRENADSVICHWPLMDCLPAVDLVIGSAGYNLYWETTVTHTPAILFAQPRKYDDQTIRSSLEGRITYAELKRRVLDSLQRRVSKAVQFENGARTVARYIARL